jgi:hypothetical protein
MGSPPVLTDAQATLRAAEISAKASRRGAWIAGLVAAVAAFAGTYFATSAASSQAHDQFIAEQRQQIYAEYIADVESVARQSIVFPVAASDEAAQKLLQGSDAIEVAYGRVRVNGGQGIIDEARTLADHLEDGVNSQVAQYCSSSGDTPSTVCLSIPKGDPAAGQNPESIAEQYKTDMDALVISMRGELKVPA